MAKPRKKTPAAPVVVVPREPPPPAKPLPEWFSHGVSTKDNRRRTQTHGQYAYQLVEACLAGKFSVPTFQRGVVWTREQQVTLLDSLIRGWTCGSLLIWNAPRDTPCRPLDGCPAYSGEGDLLLVLDGQQRLSALVAAVQGHLGVRWDGERWGDTGYLDSTLCFRGWHMREEDGLWEFQRSLHDYAGEETWTAAIAARESLYRAEIQVSVLEEYTAEEALVAYRRFNAPTTEVKLEEAPEMPSKPAIGARVAWSELEDGCLYTKTWGGCLFLLVRHGVESVAYDPSDPDIAAFVGAGEAYPPFVHQGDRSVTLIARDLGSDPEEWRQAMRDYLAKEVK